MTTVSDIIGLMERIAPRGLAEEWDNPGLQAGHPGWTVKKVVVALDATPEVVADACEQGADMLVTHHPFIFRPLKRIDYSTPVGAMIEMAARHGLAVFCAHTNLDWVSGGLNDRFCEILGLHNIRPLSQLPQAAEGGGDGLGRVGDLENPAELAELAEKARESIGAAAVRVAGPADMRVKRVAVCTGSGSGLLDTFLASDAEAFVSGDLRYHNAREAEMHQRGLIDIGHFASEHLMVDLIRRRLFEAATGAGCDIAVVASEKETDPFLVLPGPGR
jgi:dinuclear metal center YbgI/SA1388 family protein